MHTCYPEDLLELGYVIPGEHDSHLCVTIAYRDGDDGREYLVIEYDSGDGIQIKFPGGTNNDHPGETPLETARREFTEETRLVLPEKFRCVHVGPRSKNKDGSGYHQKLAFMVAFDECGGVMGTVPHVDDDGDRHSPPFWRTAAELLVDVKDGGLFWSHRPMLHDARKRNL